MSECTLSWQPRSRWPPTIRLAPGEAHLWRARSCTLAGPLRGDCLDPVEHRRAMRLIMPEQRRAYVFARTMLRVVLGTYMSVDPAMLRFAMTAAGKPYLPGQRLRFSLSHSGDGVLLALVNWNEVGVDLESIDRKIDIDVLEGASLSEAERSGIDAMDQPGRRRSILRIWTRKEALLKAEGSGLARDPRDLTLPVAAGVSKLVRVQHGGRIWTLTDVPIGEAWHASMAVEGQAIAVRGYCLGW
jgi:phosphopantetheinyl transferase